MLIEQTLFGTVDKVADAIKLLRAHEPPEGYYLCFSGGKDSVVIYDLAVKAGVKFDAHHNITTVEPPQLMKFIRNHYPDVINEHPPITMYQLIIKKKLPPLRFIRYACRKSFELNRDKFKLKHKSQTWTSGDDMFNWWINERRGYTIAQDCNQIPLFSEDDGSIL